eukprot:gene11431-12624_t
MNLSTSDSMYGCNGEIKSFLPGSYYAAIFASFLLILLVLSVFGNALVCLTIVRFSHLQTLTNAFIFSLAVTDFLTPFVRILFVSVSMFHRRWMFGCFMCQFSSVLGVFLCSCSIMHLCAISVERFIAIKWPFQHQQWINKSRVFLVISSIWITALLLSLFPYFGLVDLSFNFELLDCEISWTHNPKLALLLALFFFLFPFLVMSLTYYNIYKEVRIQTRRISATQITNRNISRKASFINRHSQTLRQDIKAVKTILVVIGTFFILWLPFFTVTVIQAYKHDSVSGPVQRLAFALAYSNSSCNWVIYSVMNREIREAFKAILKSCGNMFPEFLRECSENITMARATRRARKVTAPSDEFLRSQRSTDNSIHACSTTHDDSDDSDRQNKQCLSSAQNKQNEIENNVFEMEPQMVMMNCSAQEKRVTFSIT